MRRRHFLGTLAAGLALGPAAGPWVRVLAGSTSQSPAARGSVPIGYCTGIGSAAAAKAAGFDYVELGTSEIAGMSDADFDKAAGAFRQLAFPAPVANLFLPATIRLTGPTLDLDAQMTYVRRALDRMASLGTTTIVFGSGGARRVPDGYDQEQAFAQLVDFGKRVAPEAGRRGITIAIEPLRRQECNIINTAAEGLRLVTAIGHPNFQLMIDFYHLASESEDPAIVIRAREHLRHLHMANPQGRVFPREWTEYDYTRFFANLREIGYKGRMSVEASAKDLAADAPFAIALLRKAFQS